MTCGLFVPVHSLFCHVLLATVAALAVSTMVSPTLSAAEVNEKRAGVGAGAGDDDDDGEEEEGDSPRFETETLRGRIVWLTEALERRFGIRSVPEARERLLALETPDGRLHPLVEDIRGRAFRRDARLRDLKECELFVRRFQGSPMVQVIRLYEITEGERYELDYWCDICAITMFEMKACDCCQGDVELRRRRVP